MTQCSLIPRQWAQSFAAIAALVLAALPGHGADPPTTLHYRRVLVPQEELAQQVRGLLPLKREEFERRISQAAAAGDGRMGAARVHLASADYSARLDGDALIQGRAELAVELHGDGPAALVLDPCNLALSGSAWQGASQRPTRMGSDPAGRLVCLVEQSGKLELSWSLAGRRDEWGDLSFDLALPVAPINRLQFELPAGASLTAEGGLVTGPSAQPAAPTNAQQVSLWQVAAGGVRQLTLHVARRPTTPHQQPVVMVKENANYAVRNGTIDVETALDLDVLQAPLSQFTLELDDPLELLTVRQGEEPLPWSLLSRVAGRQRVLVHLPVPLVGETQVIAVDASAPWSSRPPLRLPRVHVAEGTWQEGRVVVTAPGAMELVATPLEGCRQTAFAPSAPARPSDEWQFQQFLPGGGVEIAVPGVLQPLVEASGTWLQFDASQVSGVLTAELSAAGGRPFAVEASIARSWIVDAVDVQPADMLEDRALESRGAGEQLLRLALRRPLTEGRPLVVVVRAHRRRPPEGQWLPADVTTIARFSGVRSARRLVACRAIDPGTTLDLSGDEDLRPLDPAALSPAELRLFDSPPGPLVFAVDQGADPLRMRLLPSSPKYRAEVFVRATVERDLVRQVLRLRCSPEGSSVSRLTVRCWPAPPEPVQWRLAGEEPRELEVQRVETPAGGADEAVFAVTLQRARSSPFEIQAEFVRPATENRVVALASLPTAAAQTGEVEIHAASGLPLAIDAPGMRWLPPPAAPAATLATLRGNYRYDPGRAVTIRLTVPPAAQSLPQAWIESLQLSSDISVDGAGQHEAVLRIHSAGQDTFRFQLPPPASELRAEIGGQPAALRRVASASGEFVLDLPADSRPALVRLTYSSPGRSLGYWPQIKLNVPVPQSALPALSRSWTVHAAPGLRLTAAAQGTAGGNGLWPPASLWSVQGGRSDTHATTTSAAPSRFGWTAYRIPLEAGRMATADGWQWPVVQAWSWCLVLATAALIARVAAGRHAELLLIAGPLAAAVLLLPPVLSTLAGGVLWGVAAGGLAALVQPRLAVSHVSSVHLSQRSTARLAEQIALGAFWLALVAAATSLTAAPAAPAAGDAAPVWRRVVMAVDDQRQPVGDYVYLEPEFYDAVLQLSDRSAADLPPWLFESCTYRLLPAAGGGGPPGAAEFLATLDAETLLPDATIELAVRRSQLHLVEGRTRLDGQSASPEWTPDSAHLRWAVARPGKHRLEFTFGAVVKAGIDDSRLEVDVPPAAFSRIVLPPTAAAVQAPAAQGAPESGAIAGERVVQLGPGGRLVLRWPLRDEGLSGAARTEGEQLILWRVRPGSVVAEGKFRVRPVTGQIRELAIEVDPRCRVLPPAAAQPIARQWVEEGSLADTLHIVLNEPATTEANVQVSLLWVGASGTGNLSLPKLRLKAGRVTRAWTAVALAGGLEWTPAPARHKDDPTDTAFASAWGEPLTGEWIALDDSAETAPVLATQPGHARCTVDQTLDCSVSSESVWVRFSARLSGLPPHAFQHRLRVVSGMRVSSLTVLEGDRPVRARWQQDPAGALVVTLNQAPAEEQRLELVGDVPLASEQNSLAAPLVEIEGAAESALTLRVYRQPDVQLSLAAADQRCWTREVDPEVGRQRERLGRLVAVLRHKAGQPLAAPTVALAPNRPEIAGTVLTRLVPDEPNWRVEIDCALDVRGGLLDTLRLEIPRSVSGPLDITPAVEHELAVIPGGTGQQLQIRPQRAIGEQLHLSIRGTLRGTDGASAALPAIAVVDAPHVRRFAALPLHSGSQRLDWETSGLQAADPPTVALPRGGIPAGHELFEAVAPEFSAVAEVRRPDTAGPRVVLADHRLVVLTEQGSIGESSFDVLPVSTRKLHLFLPPGSRLIQVEVAGIPAQIAYRGANSWQIESVSDRLPQRIRVAYSAVLQQSHLAESTWELAVPQLESVPPERTLWTISGPAGMTLVARNAGHTTPTLAQDLVRLEAAGRLLAALADVPAADIPATTLRDSLALWDARFAEIDKRAVASLASDDAPSAGLAARVESARQQAKAARDKWPARGPASFPGPIPATIAPGEEASPPSGESLIRWAPEQNETTAQLQLPGESSGPSDQSLAWAGGLIGGSCLIWRLLKRQRVGAWLAVHAHYLLALGGVVWLLVGVVPWAGWIPLGLAAWLALRWTWPRASRQRLSSVLRRSA